MSGRCHDRNKKIQKSCGNLGVRGKSSSYFFHARIHVITFTAGIQFKTCRAARVDALTQTFFPTAQIVEKEFIYKIKHACEIIIDTLITENLPERW